MVWGTGHSEADRERPDRNEDGWAVTGRAAVCLDGLGGHVDGQVASRVAVDAFLAAVTDGLSSAQPSIGLFDAMRSGLHRAQAAAREKTGPGNPSMTCAAVVAVLAEDAREVDICWAGDCRAYRYDPAAPVRLIQLTYDHDLVYHQWLHNRIDDARAGRVRWALDRAQTSSEAFHLGGPVAKKAFKRRNLMHIDLTIGHPSWVSIDLQPGAAVLLTSDGIHDNLTPDQITAAIDEHATTNHDLTELPRAIADAALTFASTGQGRAHHDDMTCVVLGGAT